jgi:enediyne core biosynthesis thioesterase
VSFEYLRRDAEGDELVARGEQEAACLRAEPDGPSRPERIPAELHAALDG